jgi:hypothetical protein
LSSTKCIKIYKKKIWRWCQCRSCSVTSSKFSYNKLLQTFHHKPPVSLKKLKLQCLNAILLKNPSFPGVGNWTCKQALPTVNGICISDVHCYVCTYVWSVHYILMEYNNFCTCHTQILPVDPSCQHSLPEPTICTPGTNSSPLE